MEMGSGSRGASGGGDAFHGLRFGKKLYFEDASGGGSRAPPSSSSRSSEVAASDAAAASPATGPRRGKGAVPGGQQQPPRCQVEGCSADLSGAKAYYCRHKVCCAHSKSPKVIVNGLEQRFCQQCSRFHQLPEFDQGKRSCRRRLAGHNERRRKPPPGSLTPRFGQLSPSMHEGGNRYGGSFILDFSHPRACPNTRHEWSTLRICDEGAPGHWHGGRDAQSTPVVVANMSHSYTQGSASAGGGTAFPGHEVPSCERFRGPDSTCALSLLSTQSWGTPAPATTTRNQAQTITENYEGGPSAQAGAAAGGFTGNSWSFRGQSSTSHEYGREMGGTGQPAAISEGQFSGELGLALQGRRHYINPGSGGMYGPGSMSHWSQN